MFWRKVLQRPTGLDMLRSMLCLKLWRLQAGLTQREAAARLGIGESTYGFLETGRMRPSRAQLLQLERSFTDPARLFEPVRERIESKP